MKDGNERRYFENSVWNGSNFCSVNVDCCGLKINIFWFFTLSCLLIYKNRIWLFSFLVASKWIFFVVKVLVFFVSVGAWLYSNLSTLTKKLFKKTWGSK